MRRLVPLALISVALAGCSSTLRVPESSGRATVWITRDRGAKVLHVAKVPAGVTAMQAVERVAKVKTRYGGRYVRAVDGVGEHGRSSWFYYVNGYLADRSAADYRLRTGDIEWWDFRSWRQPDDDPVVAGAFPEPFRHGYDGKKRPAVVRYLDPRLGKALGRLIGTRSIAPDGTPVPSQANVLVVAPESQGDPSFYAELRQPGAGPGSPVRFVMTGAFASRLLSGRAHTRFRYSVR